MKIKWLRPDIISRVFVIVGVVLLILTLKFRVNPIEGSVVNPAIRGTALHWILLYTTMPAWIAGVTLSDIASVDNYETSVVFMFLIQVPLYYFLGKIVSLVVALIRNCHWKSGKTP
ncbi:MAG: hypothetical protein ABSA16_14730 [Thermoguttaceae bacterium]|jgi:hypothetical protein